MTSFRRALNWGGSPKDSNAGSFLPLSQEASGDGKRGSFIAGVKANIASADWKVFSFMMLNFLSSYGIVITNKIVMEKYGFKFATTLTGIHFASTFLCLILAAAAGIFQIRKLPLGPTSMLAAASMGFVVLTNLSLQHNSVGFYQISKVMTTPTVVIIEALVYQKYLEPKLRLALVPVIVGVVQTASTDFRLNLVGTIYAVAGVIVTSLYQIWSGVLQKGLDANALQLQMYTAPLSGLFILPFIPLFDNYRMSDTSSIWYFQLTPASTGLIAFTGFIAFLVNVSIFLVIGKSSPLTYNILGHGKTCAIILSDFLFFGRPLDLKNVVGVLLTMSGVFWYTHLKLEKTRLEKEAKLMDADAKSPSLVPVAPEEEQDEKDPDR